jgi:signal transduction protein with GAF and PtsI domain
MSDELLAAFHEIASHVSRGHTVGEALASTVESATVLLHCDECCTYVCQGQALVPWVWKQVDQSPLKPAAVAVDCGFAAAVGMHRAPIAVAADSGKGATFKVFDEWSADPGETLVCVPFLSRSQLLGAVTLRNRRPRSYSRFEFKFLSAVGYLLGAQLGIARLQKKNSELALELETCKLVERGKGILQRDLGISEGEAYLALQRQSVEKNRPLREIAQAIILSTEVKQKAVQAE